MANLQKNSYFQKELPLTPEGIDEFSLLLDKALRENKMKQKDIIRLRLSMEEILLIWQKELGEDKTVTLSLRRFLTKQQITVSVAGDRVDPRDHQEGSEDTMGRRMLETLGILLAYHYLDGKNMVTLAPPVNAAQKLMPVAISLASSILIGIFFLMFAPDTGAWISEKLLTPIFDTCMNLLSCIAGPLIFLAVYTGIYGIGDVVLLGRLGRRLIGRFMLMTFVILILLAFALMPFYPLSLSGGTLGESGGAALLNMVLGITPGNVVDPFSTGNALQIIFLAICCGVGTLVLGRSVSELTRIIDQFTSVVQLLMSAIAKLVPAFVFICVLNTLLSGNIANMASMGKIAAVTALGGGLFLLGHLIYISFKHKVRLTSLIRKILPTLAIALATASSAATFSENIDTCRKKLGVPEQFANFGVPIGQVLYMPTLAVEYMGGAILLSLQYDVTITPVWLITAVLICAILTIATPPIPGGALTCFTVIFTQLGLPMDAVALMISVDLIMDCICTCFDLGCVQCELVISTDALGILDKGILKS